MATENFKEQPSTAFRQFQNHDPNSRAAASTNWRMRGEIPRTEPRLRTQPQQRQCDGLGSALKKNSHRLKNEGRGQNGYSQGSPSTLTNWRARSSSEAVELRNGGKDLENEQFAAKEMQIEQRWNSKNYTRSTINEDFQQAYGRRNIANVNMNTYVDGEVEAVRSSKHLSDLDNRGECQGRELTEPSRIYVGNLLYQVQKKDVVQLFTDHGFAVVNLDMSIDPMTGRNPSYCFVDLECEEEGKRAMEELSGKEILGREVRVKPGVAKRRHEHGQGEVALRMKNYDWVTREERKSWKELDIGKAEDYSPSFDRWSHSDDAPSHWNLPVQQNRRVYVGNLPRMEPQIAVDNAIQQLFATVGIKPTAVSKIISPHPSQRKVPGNHYYLFVDLESVADAALAVEKLNGVVPENWGTGKVKVMWSRGLPGKVYREQFGFERRELNLREEDGYGNGEDSGDY